MRNGDVEKVVKLKNRLRGTFLWDVGKPVYNYSPQGVTERFIVYAFVVHGVVENTKWACLRENHCLRLCHRVRQGLILLTHTCIFVEFMCLWE